MDLECVYPENQGRSKRQESNKGRRAVSNKRYYGREIESPTHSIQAGDPA